MVAFLNSAPDFDYSLGFNPRLLDIALIEDYDFFSNFWDHIDELKIIHGGINGCHNLINIKRNKTELTIHCGCQAIVIYPPRADRKNTYMVINKGKANNAKKSRL